MHYPPGHPARAKQWAVSALSFFERVHQPIKNCPLPLAAPRNPSRVAGRVTLYRAHLGRDRDERNAKQAYQLICTLSISAWYSKAIPPVFLVSTAPRATRHRFPDALGIAREQLFLRQFYTENVKIVEAKLLSVSEHAAGRVNGPNGTFLFWTAVENPSPCAEKVTELGIVQEQDALSAKATNGPVSS